MPESRECSDSPGVEEGRGSVTVTITWYGSHAGPAGEEGWRLLHAIEGAVVVARARTVVTESGLLPLPGGRLAVFRKVYSYRGFAPKLRGLFRTTFAAPSRAMREAEALRRLGALGLAPAAVACAERRTSGLLDEAVLVSEAVAGGRDLASRDAEPGLAAAAGAAAGRMHAEGLGDLSLVPRNLVAAPGVEGPWQVLKVDSGRMRAAPRGGPLQARDLADLVAGLEDRWPPRDRESLLGAYAAAAGGLPAGFAAALPAARAALGRRLPRA